jgi:8-oxo-dGTP diphosphatase
MSNTNPISLTADAVVLAGDIPHVLVIQRRWPPHQHRWALPGGYTEPGERTADTALRELREETGIGVEPARWWRIDVYDDPDRDPRGRVVSIAYATWLPTTVAVAAGDDAADARWVPVDDLLGQPDALAFDHAQILTDALGAMQPRWIPGGSSCLT